MGHRNTLGPHPSEDVERVVSQGGTRHLCGLAHVKPCAPEGHPAVEVVDLPPPAPVGPERAFQSEADDANDVGLTIIETNVEMIHLPSSCGALNCISLIACCKQGWSISSRLQQAAASRQLPG